MKKIIACLWLVSSLVFAQDFTIRTDTRQIRVGEQLTLSIETSLENKASFSKIEGLEGLELIQEKQDTLANSLFQKYILSGFEVGKFCIPPQQFFINEIPHYTDSIFIHVKEVSIDDEAIAKSKIITQYEQEPLTVDEVLYNYGWVVPAFIGVLIVIGVIVFLILRKRKKENQEPEIVIPPYETAQTSLSALEEKQLWQKNQFKKYYSELTDILRSYLDGELGLTTLESTTDELIVLVESYNKKETLGLDKESIERLRELLSQADFVKFAKQKPLEKEVEGHKNIAVQTIEKVHELIIQKNKEVNEDE